MPGRTRHRAQRAADCEGARRLERRQDGRDRRHQGRDHAIGQAWGVDARPGSLHNACDASLKALGVDRIDLYQLHRPDPDVPFADSAGALAE
ncbi:MAG: aldo/keto reductase, partial [Gemmatimonadales bacterium]